MTLLMFRISTRNLNNRSYKVDAFLFTDRTRFFSFFFSTVLKHNLHFPILYFSYISPPINNMNIEHTSLFSNPILFYGIRCTMYTVIITGPTLSNCPSQRSKGHIFFVTLYVFVCNFFFHFIR